jgi:hypothetical protein
LLNSLQILSMNSSALPMREGICGSR